MKEYGCIHVQRDGDRKALLRKLITEAERVLAPGTFYVVDASGYNRYYPAGHWYSNDEMTEGHQVPYC